MKYFDSHAHYYDARFEEECKEGIGNLLDALFATDIKAIVNVGTSPETCLSAIEQSRRYDKMYTALGIHPSDGQYLKQKPEQALREIRAMIEDPASKCVALGEIGLDYHYPDTNKEIQGFLFEQQMLLARELDMPVVIHDRDAHADVFDTVCRHPKVRGILHSYSGSPEMALELVKMGYMISFSGTLTFKNARKLPEVAKAVPKDRILIETDAPYLSPHPHRGKLNHSGNLLYTCATLAQLLGITEEECAELTDQNARRFFSLNE